MARSLIQQPASKQTSRVVAARPKTSSGPPLVLVRKNRQPARNAMRRSAYRGHSEQEGSVNLFLDLFPCGVVDGGPFLAPLAVLAALRTGRTSPARS